MRQKNRSKITAMQKIIRNKFEKAFASRLENENNVNRAMNLTPYSDLESKNEEFSLHNHSKTTNESQTHLAAKTRLNQVNEARHDPNVLCNSLKILLTTSLNNDDMERMQHIKAILDELRKLEVIM